jgi:hypothetical protein
MCLILFGGANHLLPIIQRNNDNLDFHAIELLPRDKFVKQIIPKLYVRYFGTFEGCGCLFNFGREYPEYENEKEELEAANEMRLKLLNYLAVNSVEILYSCWDGQKYTEHPITREIKIEDIARADFIFQENEIMKIIE